MKSQKKDVDMDIHKVVLELGDKEMNEKYGFNILQKVEVKPNNPYIVEIEFDILDDFKRFLREGFKYKYITCNFRFFSKFFTRKTFSFNLYHFDTSDKFDVFHLNKNDFWWDLHNEPVGRFEFSSEKDAETFVMEVKYALYKFVDPLYIRFKEHKEKKM